MDITIYLPDDIAKRAKASDVNFSRILRDELEEMFKQEDTMEATLADNETIELELLDEEGRSYIGRISGTEIARGSSHVVYLTDEDNVIIYDLGEHRYFVSDDPEEELRTLLDHDDYLDAMAAIGVTPTVDLPV